MIGDASVSITYKQLLIGVLAVIAAVIAFFVIRGIFRSIRRKIRSLSSFISAATTAAVTKGTETAIKHLDNYEKSKDTETNRKERVRVALREQSPTCPCCGAPNTSVEEFCKYCGASLITKGKNF